VVILGCKNFIRVDRLEAFYPGALIPPIRSSRLEPHRQAWCLGVRGCRTLRALPRTPCSAGLPYLLMRRGLGLPY